MLLWPSLQRADALFRSSGTTLSLDDGLDEALDEVLTLLETNDHGETYPRRDGKVTTLGRCE